MKQIVLVVLVVVEHQGRYLIVQEVDGSFYLPAGKVEPNENLIAAAVRETAEEAGVAISLRGLLGFDHQESAQAIRLRFAFVGAPALLLPPKQHADRHSRGAAWRARAEIETLPLRDPEVLEWIARYESGAPLLPCAAYEWYGAGPQLRWRAQLG